MSRRIDSRESVAAAVVEACKRLDLHVEPYVEMGHRVWGQERIVDIVVSNGKAKLGIDCHFQNSGGSAELRVFAILLDMQKWTIPGIVVYGGDGFSGSFLSGIAEFDNAFDIESVGAELRRRFGIAP